MKKVIILTAFCALAVCSAHAQRAGVSASQENGPCAADTDKVCPGMKNGGGALMNCLRQRKADVSSACRAHIDKVVAQAEADSAACRADAESFCKNLPPGVGLELKCLADNFTKLSAACKAKVGKAAPCRAEAEKLCPGIKPGPKMRECLKARESALSAECKSRMSQPGDEIKAKIQAKMQACKADIPKFCAAVKTGGGAVFKCLRTHEENLSAECRAVLPKGPVEISEKVKARKTKKS
ncbi:MAG: cysteine rich repeat-containing protein [Elusimicrobiales bacterium]